MLVSHDAGTTWRESGRGLPPGTAIAIADSDPDLLVYAGRNRLYVSRERRRLLDCAPGGAPGDPLAGAQGILNSPRATTTAEPPTRTRSIRSGVPSTSA